MSLAAGARLGPYEIVAPIGAGGMGEVYQAVDSRLSRTVALKVLSPARTGDAEFQQRFEREARTISALDHPHICSLFDVGEEQGVRFFVMPFLDGETLAARLQRGRLPLDEALTIAAQIADALDAAHRIGIVHRDVKPGNIMLTRSAGSRVHARLLDFGLAKPTGVRISGADISPTVTQEAPITGRGSLLGTAQYMAPEQFEGRDADAQSDIFALGSVIYEMVSGTRAFEGKSTASLMAAILEHEPPSIAALQPASPAALDHLIRRCLAKNPDDRWESARDVRFEIAWIRERLKEPDSSATKRSGRRVGFPLALAGGFVTVLVAAGSVMWIGGNSAEHRVTTRLSFTPADSPQLNQNGVNAGLAVSHDGRRVAYIGWSEGRSNGVLVRALDDFESRRIPGTEAAFLPFFSPDDLWIGFVANQTLKKASVDGGPVTVIADLPNAPPGHPAWTDGDTILVTVGQELLAFPASGGPSRTVISVAGDTVLGDVFALPGGRKVLMAERPKDVTWDSGRIVVIDLQSGARQVVIERGYAPRYVVTGHIVFAREAQLFAVRFDHERLIASGAPTAIAETVTFGPSFGYMQAGLSTDGTLAYLTRSTETRRKLVWVDRSGSAQTALPFERPFQHPRLSPTGDRVVLGTRDPSDIWVGHFARGTLDRLILSPFEDESPIWHPDGRRLTFAAARGAARRTLVRNADGSGDEEVLFEHGPNSTSHHHLGAWSADGGVLTFTMFGDVHVLKVSGTVTTESVTQTRSDERAASLSTDGRLLAYTSDESGREEVYVRPFPGPGSTRQISSDGGSEPLWSRDGRELFFRSGNRMMAVDLTWAPAFSARTPHVLFEGNYDRIAWAERNYDVSPDGRRFLMLVAGPAAPPEIRVVVGWGEELKRLVR